MRVRVVNNYADTSMTTRTLFETFEDFSQILEQQSGKKVDIFDFLSYILRKSKIELRSEQTSLT